MLRLSTILLFLAVAVLSVLAAPTPIVAATTSFTLRQATRADIVSKRNSTPVRRQGPSPVPFVPRPFRLRVPVDSPAQAFAGGYFINQATGGGGQTPFADSTTDNEPSIYQLSSTGTLQTLSDLTVQGFVSGAAQYFSTVVFVTPAVGNDVGGSPLACSVNANFVLACTDSIQSARTVGINPSAQAGALAFIPTGISPVVVQYL